MPRKGFRYPLEHRFMKNVAVQDNGCWLWTGGIAATGYGRFWLDGETTGAHQAAYRLFIDEIPKGKEICHTCDVRNCVNPDHLWIGTKSENILDRHAKGRSMQGEQVGTSKLTEKEVIQIKLALDQGMTQREIAKQFQVHQTQISRIKLGQTWAHVETKRDQTISSSGRRRGTRRRVP